jgi:dTDP-4-dehydrorhamnose 3,5-epimerase
VKFTPLSIPDVFVIEPDVFFDDRGFVMETYHELKFKKAGITHPFVQENHSHSKQGVLRGMHYQVGQAQGKLVRVISGEVYDVLVDLRRSSPTFKLWSGVVLSDANRCMVWAPPGFAHGFYVLSSEADVVYLMTNFYLPDAERTLRWNDPEIGIDWPLVAQRPLILSAKDASAVLFKETPASDLFE